MHYNHIGGGGLTILLSSDIPLASYKIVQFGLKYRYIGDIVIPRYRYKGVYLLYN